MSNLNEIKKILNELTLFALGRKRLGEKPLSFDIRLESAEMLLSEFAIKHNMRVPLPEFLTSDELFLVESLLS